MKQKLLDLLEKYIDKIILLIIAVASLAILWSLVIANPYAAKVGRIEHGPGSIDAKIAVEANRLAQHINGNATKPYVKYGDNKAGLFEKKLASTVSINEKASIVIADRGVGNLDDKRFYRKPEIPPVQKINAEAIRTAVFVPTEKVDMTLPYQQAKTEVKDIDFVTVEGSIDVTELYKNFKKSFVTNASADYKDENLAKPVFAAIGLERQVRREDGQWSDWQLVERPSIDMRKGMFNVPQKVENIDLGGIEVLLMNFNKFEVQKDLLQPGAYDIAASNAEWMTPTYHKELVKFIEKQKETEQREKSGRVRPVNRRRTDAFRPDVMNELGGRRPGERTARDVRRERLSNLDRRGIPGSSNSEDRTIEDIRADFDFLEITEDLDMSLMKEPLVFWAFDEDIQPRHSYRYRIRVGIFNPTAGKGWFSGSDAEYKDDVILWSEFSDVTEAIEIEPMVYFFPLEIARRTNEAAIQVSKFHHGKWRSEDFQVQVGEPIGHEIEVELEDDPLAIGRSERSKTIEDIKVVDFSSGAILVDIVKSTRSVAGGRMYHEILYTLDGEDINHLGISKRNWSKSLIEIYNKIEEQKDIKVQIYETRGQSGRRGIYPGGPGQATEEFEDYMNEMDGFGEF